MPNANRRQAILDAALDVFAEAGFAAARLEDVAARAGIAKGTIYLHFQDKRALFMEMVRSATAPMFDRVGELARLDAPVRELLLLLAEQFAGQVLGTRRKEVFRLVLAEAGRFPEIAEFYHRDVISRMLPILTEIFARALARGELANDSLARFPHLFMAPFVLCVMWDGMFANISPLDSKALLLAHIDLLTRRQEQEE